MGRDENAERLASALSRKAEVLKRAAQVGCETHLVLIQSALGSTDHWIRMLADSGALPLPHFLWVIDLSADPSLGDLAVPSDRRALVEGVGLPPTSPTA